MNTPGNLITGQGTSINPVIRQHRSSRLCCRLLSCSGLTISLIALRVRKWLLRRTFAAFSCLLLICCQALAQNQPTFTDLGDHTWDGSPFSLSCWFIADSPGTESRLFARGESAGNNPSLQVFSNGIRGIVGATNANEGAGGRNFGFGIYGQDGSLKPDELKELYEGDGGIKSFLEGKSNIINVQPVPMPQPVRYSLPTIDLSAIVSGSQGT